MEHAVVVLITEVIGQHIYRWDADTGDFSADTPISIRDWKFEGGPRDFNTPS